MTNYVENPPDVRRAADAYRDAGYDFPTSVADLVDNAIGAGQATKVKISISLDKNSGDIRFFIVDDGVGMDRPTMERAMTVGSGEDLLKHELSKYGHGMKTATWAHAKGLILISRAENSAPASAMWDLDHVIDAGKWEMEVSSKVNRQYLEDLDEFTGGQSGTLLAWEKVDRLLSGYQSNTGPHRMKALSRLVEEARSHLGLVFHRYLDPTYESVKTVELWLNEEPVRPWDPFASSYGDYEVRDLRTTLKSEGRNDVDVRAYLLPREDDWGFEESYRSVVGQASESQGFYLYRADRLIMEPTWLRMVKQEPHSNLARVQIDLNPSWDDILHVDFKKSTVQFPDAQKDELRTVMTSIIRMAKAQRGNSSSKKQTTHSHKKSDQAISNNRANFKFPNVQSLDEANRLASIATSTGTLSGLRVVDPSPQQTVNIVVAEEGLPEGKLWEPIVVRDNNGSPSTALALNAKHEFYVRVYLPAAQNEVGKKAMDLLLWSIMNAETNTTNDQNKRLFEDLRYEMSRTLRTLAEELPDFDPYEEN